MAENLFSTTHETLATLTKANPFRLRRDGGYFDTSADDLEDDLQTLAALKAEYEALGQTVNKEVDDQTRRFEEDDAEKAKLRANVDILADQIEAIELTPPDTKLVVMNQLMNRQKASGPGILASRLDATENIVVFETGEQKEFYVGWSDGLVIRTLKGPKLTFQFPDEGFGKAHGYACWSVGGEQCVSSLAGNDGMAIWVIGRYEALYRETRAQQFQKASQELKARINR